ncbi:alpha/beta hydrolase family protein [Saccharopolyspora sp. 5N708]|uniref:alpha/beta hydrolase family protein n=1 Tax=Saccharopolyspora sp. 5N708 TaxID=3457424 RepID=UPI003FD5496E
MRTTKILRAAVGGAAVVAVALAVPGAVHYRTETTAVAVPMQSVIGRDGAGTLLSVKAIENLDPVLASVSGRADRITYRSRSLPGRDIVVSGALFTPKGTAPRGGWPVVSWYHGSTGIIDQCAPSTVLNKDGKVDLYGYGGFVAQLLKAGYAVAATDYEGLGSDGEHPYIVADSEGRGGIDAVRAAIQAEPNLSKSYFNVGHSQGGQGAIAAGEMAQTYGQGLDFRGTVGLAPVTNVGQAYGYGYPANTDRGFYLLALYGLKTVHPELRFDQYLGSQALDLLPKVTQECTAEIWTDFSANFGDKLNDWQFAPQDAVAALKIQDWLDRESVPRGKTPGGMLLLQGTEDPSIKKAVTYQAVRNARAAGTSADFRLYPGKDHYSVLTPRSEGGAGDDVIDWLNKHVRK